MLCVLCVTAVQQAVRDAREALRQVRLEEESRRMRVADEALSKEGLPRKVRVTWTSNTHTHTHTHLQH